MVSVGTAHARSHQQLLCLCLVVEKGGVLWVLIFKIVVVVVQENKAQQASKLLYVMLFQPPGRGRRHNSQV